MSSKLVIEFRFSDDSDLDFYRTSFVSNCENMAEEATDKDGNLDDILGSQAGRADGEIEVNWDIED